MNEETEVLGHCMNKPTLSVIMPNYNHGKFIEQALEGVLSQTYVPMEIIVADDESTDNSLQIIRSVAKRSPIVKVIVNEKNRGVNHNLQMLLNMVQGDYVYGAAADDFILPGFLEKCMRLLATFPQAGLCSSLSFSMNEKGEKNGTIPTPIISKRECYISPDRALKLLYKEGPWIQGNTAIWRADALRDSGGFIPELKSYSDGFMQQVVALKYGVCFVPEYLAVCRISEKSYSGAIGKDMQLQLEIAGRATKLMRTSYNQIFPEKYVEIWERRTFYSIFLHSLASAFGQQVEYLKSIVVSKSKGANFIYAIVASIYKFANSISKVYLAMHYKQVGFVLKTKIARLISRLLRAFK